MDVAANAELAEEATQAAPAGPWARFWARSLDTVIEGLVLGAVFGLAFPRIATSAALTGSGGTLILGVLGLPFVLALDAAIQAIFGQTLGKWIAGIRVERMDGGRPAIATALRRNAELYLRGLVLGLPLVCVVGYMLGYQAVKERRPTAWDRRAATRVRARGSNLVRTSLAAVFALAVYAGLSWPYEETPPSAPLGEPELAQSVADGLAKANAGLPRQIDDVTRLDRIEYARADHRVVYIYTLASRDGSAVDPGLPARIASPQMRERVKAGYCGAGDRGAGAFHAAGQSVSYRYLDPEGVLIKDYVFAPADC